MQPVLFALGLRIPMRGYEIDVGHPRRDVLRVTNPHAGL